MEMDFNKKYAERTKKFSVILFQSFKIRYYDSSSIIVRQLLRSGSSVAANFRAATRARSSSEYFSKLSIVVEECDETLFWLEILEEVSDDSTVKMIALKAECEELLKIFSSTRKKLKQKLKDQ